MLMEWNLHFIIVKRAPASLHVFALVHCPQCLTLLRVISDLSCAGEVHKLFHLFLKKDLHPNEVPDIRAVCRSHLLFDIFSFFLMLICMRNNWYHFTNPFNLGQYTKEDDQHTFPEAQKQEKEIDFTANNDFAHFRQQGNMTFKLKHTITPPQLTVAVTWHSTTAKDHTN